MKKIKIGYSEISTSQLGQMEKYGVLRKNLEILSVFLSFCLQYEKSKKAYNHELHNWKKVSDNPPRLMSNLVIRTIC